MQHTFLNMSVHFTLNGLLAQCPLGLLVSDQMLKTSSEKWFCHAGVRVRGCVWAELHNLIDQQRQISCKVNKHHTWTVLCKMFGLCLSYKQVGLLQLKMADGRQSEWKSARDFGVMRENQEDIEEIEWTLFWGKTSMNYWLAFNAAKIVCHANTEPC